MFKVGNTYSKKDIYELLNVPLKRRRGEWDKGYREYEGNIFIFTNVGIPGRTGHDYNNYWDGDLFVWEAVRKSNIRHPSIQKMLKPSADQKIFLFTRTDDRLPFTFEGTVAVKSFEDTSPVKIIWEFTENPYGSLSEELPSQFKESKTFYEGAVKQVFINKYERNPLARRMCIEHYGCHCNVCEFDFYFTYGDLGKGYIHVHHIIPISKIGKEYVLKPEKDLIPVCPNCHTMIHKKIPPLKISDLKELFQGSRNKKKFNKL